MKCRKIIVLLCTIVSVFFVQAQSFGQTTFPSGSAIIDMGSATPTVKNSLKPYGLVYALLKNNHVPVNYVVNSTKVKDGIDFVYNGKGYKGGTFIISGEYISSDVSLVLNSWVNQGVLIDYTTSSLTVTPNYKLNFVPKWVMDKTNGSIAVNFLNSAGIPASAYSFKNPADLGTCDDIFVLPHADPTWANHGNLFVWNRDNKGAIWAGCHAVSVLESLFDPVTPANKMNFLSTNGLIPFTDHNPTSIPFANFFPGDPVAQFLGKTDGAQLGGSETVYLPKSGSAWRAGAKVLTTSPSQADLPSLDAGTKAVENIYGRAFDDPARGYVAYQASHNIASGGTIAEQVAAQRIFFNFSLFALNDKIPPIINIGLGGQPTQIKAGTTTSAITATNSGAGAITSYTWSVSPSSAGTINTPTAASTTFTASAGITNATTVIISCVVTEACGRVSFDSKSFTIIPNTTYPTPATINKSVPDGCVGGSITFNVFDSNVDANAGTRTMVSLTGLAGGTVLSSTSGSITFTSDGTKGVTTGTYTLSNDGGITQSPAGTINITVGDATQVPTLTNDAATALVNSITAPITVLANDKTTPSSLNADGLYIRDISRKPSKGVVYISADGRSLTYLSNSGQSGIDDFDYLACNTVGYCSTGTLSVTLIDNCGNTVGGTNGFTYQSNQTLTPLTSTFNPSADSYLDQASATTNRNGGNLTVLATSGQQKRPVIKFDLSSLPTTSVVSDAMLSLTVQSTFTTDATTAGANTILPVSINPFIKAFVESEVTYNVASVTPALSWTTAGATSVAASGDITNTGSSTIQFVASTTFNDGDVIGSVVKTLASNWVKGTVTNNGILLRYPSNKTAPAMNFYSRETGVDATHQPRLTVSYYPCITRPVNYAPAVYPDAVATSSALTLTISPLTNDVNYYGNTNKITLLNASAAATVNTISGTASIITGGTQILYTPSGGFVGIDTLTYTVTDQSNSIASTGTIRITVSRSAPIVLDDAATVNSGTLTTINVGANDLDRGGGMGAPIIITAPLNGSAVVNASNNIEYTPTAGFVGTDRLTYRRLGVAADACSSALSGTATVTITVNNQPPVAGPGTLNTFACVTGSVKVADIASDPESGTLSATIATNPSHGTVAAKADGTLVYTPTTAYSGTDAFTYTVTDPLNATSAAGTVSITVSGASNPNIAPVAVADADNTLANQPVYTNVLINDSDPNNDALNVNITAIGLAAPVSGTITVMPNKLIKYTPNTNFTGTDTYQYQLTDTHPGCSLSASLNSIATVTITVKAIPTTLSGTVWNDVDNSAANTFVNIKTNTETGTNGNGSIYIYVVNASNIVVDKTPVDIDGTYLLSNVPSVTSGLSLILSIDDVTVGSTLSTGSVPTGYTNSTPLTRTLPITTVADMGPYDWGIYSNPVLSPGSIAASANYCGTTVTPAALTSVSNASGGSVTATGYVYQWQSSTTSASAGFADISGANATTYTPGVISTTTYYKRIASTNLNSAVSSNVVTIALTANPTTSITPAIAVIAAGGNIGLSATGANSYTWSPSTGLSATTGSGVTATPVTTTMYTVTGTLTPSGCINTASLTVTVTGAGTIAGNQVNCGPFVPGSITSVSSASGGAADYQWQYSTTSAAAGYANIAGATATGYTPSGTLTITTYYRRVAIVSGVTNYSNVITKTVNALPSTSVTPSSIIISSGLTATLTASGADSYSWSPSATLSANNTASVIASPTTTTTYNVTGTITASGCTATGSSVVTVTGAGTIAGNEVNCGPFVPAQLTSVSAASGGAADYQWQYSTTSAATGYANIAGATATSYTPSATITITTYYRRTAVVSGVTNYSNVITKTVNALPSMSVTPSSITISSGFTATLTASGADSYSWSPSATLSANNTASVIASPTTTTTYNVTGTVTASGCTATGSSVVTVTDAGIIAGNQVNCGPFVPGTISSVSLASGGAVNYLWQYSTTSSTTGFANIAGAVAISYTPSVTITTTTYYRRGATISGTTNYSNVITKTVNALPSTSVTPSSIIISSGLTATLTASGADTYSWSPSATLSANNTASVIASPTTTTTYNVTGTITVSGCTATGSSVVTVTDAGIIAGNQVNCGPFVPGTISSVSLASGGAVNYLWQYSTTSSTTGFANIAGAVAISYTPSGTITTTTYYRRGATISGTTNYSNVITKTVNALPSTSVTPSSIIISSGLTATLTASGADTYSWSPSATLSANNTASVIASPTTTTTYNVTGTITVSGCTATGSSVVTVLAAGSLIPGIIGSNQSLCSLATPGAFTSTGASGGTGTINYQWQSSTDNTTFTNITGATAATYTAPPVSVASPTLSVATYYRRGASTSSDAAVYTSSVKVTVLSKPSVTLNGPCALQKDSIKTFTATTPVNATTYVWTLPSGYSGTSVTNTINVKAGSANGNISVTPYNNVCAGTPALYAVAIIDYAQVTITGTPVAASGNANNPITVTITLIDVQGNIIHCSGGTATMCTNSGTFSTVTDNNDGTYTSTLVSPANDVQICGTIGGIPLSQTTHVTFTGPQGGIKSNGPILVTEIPKITFTATAGRAPFTVVYHSAKKTAGLNDTLANVTSGVAYNVAQIPSTTLYTLVKVIDANNEFRIDNFNRDTTTTLVVAPKVIITLKADPAVKQLDSTWVTRIVVNTKNIGDLDLSNSQARLNLHDVFPSPVTYTLDSVRVTGATVIPNANYDGVNSTDLFARINRNKRSDLYTTAPLDISDANIAAAPDGSTGNVEIWSSVGKENNGDEQEVRVIDDGHSVYMFGPLSNLPVGASAQIILWLHVKPNGYTDPFIMQAVALGTGHTEGATALTTSLSNDNNDVSQHPEVTGNGTPLPAVINLFPTASIGVAMSAGTPQLQSDGTYNVLLSYKLKNYGNLNLRSVNLLENLLRSIGSPASFSVVSPVTSTNNLFPNPSFDAKTDTSMLLPNTSILGYKQEATVQFTINITPNQLSAVYRLQSIASGYSDDLLTTVTDLSTDGTNPDPDGNNIPSEKIITIIAINTPIPPVVPGTIGIKTGPTTTVLAKGYCPVPTGIVVIPTSLNSGGLDATYKYQWQSSSDNTTFTDLIGSEDSIYTTGVVNNSFYLRRGTISANQIQYSNSVYIQVYPAPSVPVITASGTQIVGTGSAVLTSTAGTTYLWSTGATTRSITATAAGNYSVTVGDANGCPATSLALAVTAIDPSKVADIQKVLSRPVTPQADGSYIMGFTVYTTNLRAELLDTVRVTDNLSAVFPSTTTFQVTDIKASGKLIANTGYNGTTQTNMLNDVSQLAGSKTDSIEMSVKVFPNGFAGRLLNTAVMQARSPLGSFSVTSNDPTIGSGTAVRNPTPFVLPALDIFIPGGFSPNHDGINDLFVIQRPFNTNINFELFNRWGNLVYRSPAPDYKNDFDGHGNQDNRILGDELPDGTYYYIVVATDKTSGAVRKFQGFITVKR